MPRRRNCSVRSRRSPTYALHELEADKGFFQEHGRLSAPRCKTITREVNRLCDAIRGEAGEFVDAFAIPDAVLAAPIGQREAP